MNRDADLRARLEAALASADVDVGELVDAAWAEARDDVRDVLREVMTRDLLARCLEALEPRPTARPAEAAGESAPGSPPGSPVQSDPAPRSAREGRPNPRGETATYLFGIGQGTLELPGDDLPAVPGSGPLRTVEHGGLTALVCDVDTETLAALDAPGPGGIDVLAGAARAHDATLAALAAAGAVLPLRLGTVLRGDDDVEAVLAMNASGLLAELRRVAGHHEWAVTVHLTDVPGSDDRDDAPPPATGRDYLEAQRDALERRAERFTVAEEIAASIHARLASRSAEAVRVHSRPVEDVAPPLLHGAYLVDERRRDGFDATIAELRDEHPGARIDVTGPWPPYHFTDVDLGVDDAEVAS